MPKKLPVELIALERVHALSFQLALQILDADYHPDVVIAIARGGFVPARFLCDFLNLSDMTSIKVQHYAPGAQKQQAAYVKFPLSGNINGLRVLIVDDVNDTGETLVAAVDHVRGFYPAEMRTAVLHEKLSSPLRADFTAESVKEWRWMLYPWAVNEDIGRFLREMDPPVTTPQEAARRLREDYGIELPEEQLKRVLTLMSHQSGETGPSL